MNDNLPQVWPRPDITNLEGRHVIVTRLNPDMDVDDLYDVSHSQPEYKALWTYMGYGPFARKERMYAWLDSIKDSLDPVFYTVASRHLNRKVGMLSILNIHPDMGRAELGNIWYSPLAQKTRVNTEVTYLFLRHLMGRLKYRRIEWKCDDNNEPSKKAALRMGFRCEGLFRNHMIVKGKNRDTAWFSIIDSEWARVQANFEEYLASDGQSLAELNAQA